MRVSWAPIVLFKTKYSRNIFTSYLAQIFSILSAFGTIYVINKFGTMELYGQLTIIVALSSSVSNIVSPRTGAAVTRFYKEAAIENNREHKQVVLAAGIVIDLITGVVSALILLLVSDFFAAHFLKDDSLAESLSLFSLVPFFLLSRSTAIGYFTSLEKFWFLNSIIAFEHLLKLVLVTSCAFLFTELSVNKVVICYVSASFVVSLIYYVFFLKRSWALLSKGKFCYDRCLMRDFFYYSVKTFATTTMKSVNQNAGNLILAYFTTSSTVGIYETIRRLSLPITYVAKPYPVVSYPVILGYHINKSIKEMTRHIKAVTKKIVILSLFMLVAIFLLERYILELLNVAAFESEMLIVLICLVGVFIQNMSWWGAPFSNSVNPVYGLKVTTLSFVVQTMVSPFLIYYFGIIGIFLCFVFINILAVMYYYSKFVSYSNEISV